MCRSILEFGLILSAAVAVGSEPATAPPPRVIPIAALVKQLGSKESIEREAATRRLSAMALDPPPELLATTKSDDPEVRERALTVAQIMRWNVAATRLSRGQRFIEQGRVDLFVAATAVWDLKPDDPRLWEPAVDFGWRLLEKSEMKGNRRPNAYLILTPPRFTRMNEQYIRQDIQLRNEAIQAAGVAFPGGICNNLIISRGNVSTQKGISMSVVLANGDVTAVTGLSNVVIVCDGDVNLTDRHVSKALIVARGNITVGRSANSAVLIAGGKVTLGENRKLPEEVSNVIFNVIKENTTDMLGITFFELSTVGVEVKLADVGLRVVAVADGKPFSKAGVKIGDVVTEVNGKKPDSGESLRRLLRDALAIGDATLNVKRGDKTETITVTLPE